MQDDNWTVVGGSVWSWEDYLSEAYGTCAEERPPETMSEAAYKIQEINDSFMLIVDLDEGRSVTTDAGNVIAELNESIEGGLGKRSVYYHDTMHFLDMSKRIFDPANDTKIAA